MAGEAFARAMGSDGYQDRMNAALRQNWKYAVPLRSYTTDLPPSQEQAFRQWVQTAKIPFSPDEAVTDYDMRGYWLAHQAGQAEGTKINPNDGLPHFPDTFKTPYHQSFSGESMYAKPGGPVWINDHQLADPKTGQILFDERLAGPEQ